MLRRNFLKLLGMVGGFPILKAGASPASAATDEHRWRQGALRHVLPAVSDSEFLIKTSFVAPRLQPPSLIVGDKTISGRRTDTAGRFWEFRASSLEADCRYELSLVDGQDARAKPLCDPWHLKTFPDAQSRPETVRLLFYSCAGGDENGGYLPTDTRSRLLRRALSFAPDAAIANGDHVYRDLRPQRRRAWRPPVERVADRKLPILGTESEEYVIGVGDRQIVDVYGVEFRSTPVFFIQDDHDYFENDEATDRLITFPPDPFMTELARVTQNLYYPEFLPSPYRPTGLPGDRTDHPDQMVSESFGTLRYGLLLEALMYTVRRTLTLEGEDAVFVSPDVEDWLKNRMADDSMDHLINIPSTPPGWTAGKWGEWYPDRFDKTGHQSAWPPKDYWQAGWLRQHDRILTAFSNMAGRIPLVVSGDLHASALGCISRTGASNLSKNPVIAVLCGALGTGTGWPSRTRGAARPPLHIEMEQLVEPIEQNGFTIADITPDKIVLRMFVWDARNQKREDIDRLEPFRTEVFSRP